MAPSLFPEIFPKIETARLTLREITRDDATAIFRNFSDPDVAKWFFEAPLTEIEQALQFIDVFMRDFEQKEGLTWAIVLKETGECLGTCGYGDVESGKRGEIGFDLDKAHWGQGLMTEALSAITGYGYESLSLLNVDAHTYSRNSRAIRLLEKLGFNLDHVTEDESFFALSKEAWGKARP